MRKNTWPGPGRTNRGLTKVISFKVTEDCHDALLEYIAKSDGIDLWPNLPKGAPYGDGLADHVRRILARFLTDQLGREVLVYEYEDSDA